MQSLLLSIKKYAQVLTWCEEMEKAHKRKLSPWFLYYQETQSVHSLPALVWTSQVTISQDKAI